MSNPEPRKPDSFVRRWWMAIVGIGALVIVIASQTSNASTGRWNTQYRSWTKTTTTTSSTVSGTAGATTTTRGSGSGTTSTTSSTSAAPLEILATNCDSSRLQDHDGFQLGPRCVDTAFGEVASQENNPTLLISSAPRFVSANTPFNIVVSSRNLVRDRFLAAAQGGYYAESSLLTDGGLTRGHLHTACRMLSSRRTAPVPDPAPAFFKATEDKRGGASPDTVTIQVSGLPAGEAQCAVWAGDGSHRIPMMQRANQIPAIDVVRISVR